MSLLLAAGSSDPNKTQSLAVTLDGVTIAVSQTLQHGQALSATLADVTAAIAQSKQYNQTLAVTLADVTAAVSQGARHPQSLAITLDDITAAVSQVNRHNETIAFALADVIVSVSQSIGALVAKRRGLSYMYVPGIVPDRIEALPRFIDEELNKIRIALEILAAGHIDETSVAPAKPRKGDYRLADGTNWNPGSGAGFYGYYGGAWVKLG